MQHEGLYTPFTLLGVLLIIAGLILIASPYIAKLFSGGEAREIHPLLFIGFKVDGVTVGTSPIIIVALVLIYLFLLMQRG